MFLLFKIDVEIQAAKTLFMLDQSSAALNKRFI